MALAGNDKALTQVEAFDVINLKLYGSVAFLLWKSVYITKQVGAWARGCLGAWVPIDGVWLRGRQWCVSR